MRCRAGPLDEAARGRQRVLNAGWPATLCRTRGKAELVHSPGSDEVRGCIAELRHHHHHLPRQPAEGDDPIHASLPPVHPQLVHRACPRSASTPPVHQSTFSFDFRLHLKSFDGHELTRGQVLTSLRCLMRRDMKVSTANIKQNTSRHTCLYHT